MRTPSFVATDLDGTLIRSDGTVSDRSRRALRQVEASGATVVLATGRPIRVMGRIVEQTGATGLAICGNGAIVYDLDTGTLIADLTLDRHHAGRLVTAIRDIAPDSAFAVESGTRFGREPDFGTQWPDEAEVVGDAADLITELSVSKLLVRRGGRPFHDVLETIVAVAGDDAVITSSSHDLLEISGKGVSKAAALAQVCAARGVGPDGVIAFGDMPNDTAMLIWAGYAVAVANAHPEVIAVADEVTASNDSDGVAAVLERLYT